MAVSKKKSVKPAAKKVTKSTKKTAAKKTAAKKTAAKKTVKKATVKKAVSKKSIKKAVTKKPTVKKSVKKTTVKKGSIKKTAPKRVTAKTVVAKPSTPNIAMQQQPVNAKKEIVHTKEERRRQYLALFLTGLVILLALIIINRREDETMVRRLVNEAKVAEKAGLYPRGIRKLDAALRVLDRIKSRIPKRRLAQLEKLIKQRLKRLLLLEADRLRKLARQLEGEGKEDDALKVLKQAQDALTRLRVQPWKGDSRLQKVLDNKMKNLDKDRQRLSLRNEEVDRLLKRAKQDEDDGLYKDALKKLDLVLDLLDKLEKDLRKKDKAEQKVWFPKIKGLRKVVRSSRRRINGKLLARDRQNSRDQSKPRDGETDAARRKRLEQENRRLRDALRNQNGKKGTTGNKGPGVAGRGKTGGTTIKPKDIKTKVKDVNPTGKKKIDYGKSADIEKD